MHMCIYIYIYVFIHIHIHMYTSPRGVGSPAARSSTQAAPTSSGQSRRAYNINVIHYNNNNNDNNNTLYL